MPKTITYIDCAEVELSILLAVSNQNTEEALIGKTFSKGNRGYQVQRIHRLTKDVNLLHKLLNINIIKHKNKPYHLLLHIIMYIGKLAAQNL